MFRKLRNLSNDSDSLRREFLRYHQVFKTPRRPKIILPEGLDESQILSHIFTYTDGIIFGEEHFDNVSAGFLAEHMDYLVDIGVDTFFFEGLLYGFENGASYTRDVADSVHEEYQALIEKAKSNSIKIIGLDSMGCKRGEGVTRTIFMNAHAQGVINSTKKGKWLALVGMMHLNDCEYICPKTLEKYGVRGLAEFTGAASMILKEAYGTEKYIETDVSYEALPAKKINADFLMGVHSYKRIPLELRGKRLTNHVKELSEKTGFDVTYFDIDTFAKKHPKAGYYKGFIFALAMKEAPRELERIKYDILTRFNIYNSGAFLNNHWLDIKISGDELIFSCHFDIIESVTSVIDKVCEKIIA